MKLITLSLACLLFIGSYQAQNNKDKGNHTLPEAKIQNDTIKNKKDGHYYFTVVKDIESLDVQSQGRTGTCWSFSSLSFLESEIIRNGKKPVSLSEMFIARNAYLEKAITYVRMHGNFNFSAGGAFHDIPYIIKKYGIVPEEIYSGLNYGEDKHNHAEMDAILKAAVDQIVKNPQRKLTTSWQTAIEGILDAYLGKIPEEFEFNGKKYTPKSYAASLGLNMDDYIAIGSFTHHPFYGTFVLEVPDNWGFGTIYNVPMDEMEQIMNDAVMKGYSIAWGSDVSEKGFSFSNGLAIVPEDEATIQVKGKDNKHFSDAGAEKVSNAFDEPVEEKKITQEMRQEGFDNYQTQDDHGMHITGIVKDQKGNKYYIVKNSWGKENYNDGYFYASTAYVKYKTIDFMVHKDALSKDLKNKLNIK
ncbi:MAG: aminopeptidase [Flavobacteriales bacterium]|nr:aminopeptidase [Flavobacteriales bacterium]MCB9365122.1 aminopeptidase [Flavobacteriales bacterium]